MSVDSGPSGQSAAVTTSDTQPLPVGRALYVGTGGTIIGRLKDDTADTTWLNVPSGSLLSVRFQYIRTTGTTAAAMLILF